MNAVNGTLAAGGLSELLHETIPGAWTSTVTFLVSWIGPATTYVLFTLLATKLTSMYNGLYFDYIYRNGYYEKYRIQNDRRIPDALQDMAWENRHGLAGTKGLFTTGIPLMYIAYFAMNRLFGINVLRMPTSYKAAAWEFFIGTVAWDAFLFWAHYALHKVPGLYKIHKKHHEFKTVSTITGGHLTFLDFIIMDYAPTRFGIVVGNMSFPVIVCWLIFYTHIASRAHCGYALPWDPLTWFAYVENHDFHHRRTHANYQTLFFYWDWLVGGFGDFWEWRKRRWDPAQWKDGVGFVNKVDRDRDGTEPIGEDTMATLEKSKVKKVK